MGFSERGVRKKGGGNEGNTQKSKTTMKTSMQYDKNKAKHPWALGPNWGVFRCVFIVLHRCFH